MKLDNDSRQLLIKHYLDTMYWSIVFLIATFNLSLFSNRLLFASVNPTLVAKSLDLKVFKYIGVVVSLQAIAQTIEKL